MTMSTAKENLKYWVIIYLFIFISGYGIFKIVEDEINFLQKDKRIKRELALQLKKDEGFRSCPYRDSSGLLTVGHGHVLKGEKDLWMLACIDESEATRVLEEDIDEKYDDLEKLDTRYVQKLSEEKLRGILGFQFNIGTNAYKSSTAHKLFNKVFLKNPEYLECSSVEKVLFLTQKELSSLRRNCKKNADKVECKQLKILGSRNKLKNSIKAWNKATVRGRLTVEGGLITRRAREMELIIPSCENRGEKF